MKLKNILAMTLIAASLLPACQEETDFPSAQAGDTVTMKFTAARASSATPGEGAQAIGSVRAYRFEGNTLAEALGRFTPDAEGRVSLHLTSTAGTLYFLANAGGVDGLDGIDPGTTTLDAFRQMTVSGDEQTAEGLPMTGQIPASGLAKENTVSMLRAVARVDVDARVAGVEVNRVSLSGVATQGFVWEQETVATPSTAGQTDRVKEFAEPLKQASTPIFYLYEQENRMTAVEIIAHWDGGEQHLTAQLPKQLKRNTVYTLKVYGKGASLKVEVLADEWESGESADAGLERKGLVDPSASTLGDGVRVNANRDVVYIPYTASTSQIALLAEAGSTVKINGTVEEATVSSQPASAASRALQPTVTVSVSNRIRYPGTLKEFVYIDVYSPQGTRKGRVTLEFAPNPVMIKGTVLKFDKDGACHFGRYIDGDFGTLILPDSLQARLDFPDDNPQWMKLEAKEDEENTFRILGGWRPNDKDADGRTQTALLTVTHTDGSAPQTYTITRKNYGLPVVKIKDTWWCKYNLRGNVKRFEDQIWPKSDPTAERDWADYLKTCTDDEFLSLLGDQYLAGKPDGMKLTYDEETSSFHYEGYQKTGIDFGSLPATEMAPDGYQLPGYDDFRFFTWSNNSAMPHGSNKFGNGLEGDRKQRFTYSIVERDATFKGHNFGPVSFYDFRFEDQPDVQWILYGLGHQWDETNIEKMSPFFAICDRKGSSWFIIGTPNSKGNTDYYKFSGQGAEKTRNIRCIKTPVEYIY